MPPRSQQAALFRRESADRKLSPVELVSNTTDRLRPVPLAPFCSSTYVSIAKTCPSSCTFKSDGCYVTEGFTGVAAKRLDLAARNLSGDEVIRQEAALISRAFYGGRVPQDGARGGRDLRLHVGGDVSSELGARMLAGAAIAWKLRGGGDCWSYTHAWREVLRSAWGPAISVLASVESASDADFAMRSGYAAAIVVPAFPSKKAFSLKGIKVIPCPAETAGTTCVQCRLCFDDRKLLERESAIGFAAHGRQAERIRRRLPVLTLRNIDRRPQSIAEVPAV